MQADILWLLVQWEKNEVHAFYYCSHLRKSHTAICISVTCGRNLLFAAVHFFFIHPVPCSFCETQSQVSLPLFEAAEKDAQRAKVENICTQTSNMLIMRATGFSFIMTTTNLYEQDKYANSFACIRLTTCQ